MNWLVLAALAWVMLGMELGLRDALELGQSGIAPSFVTVLLAVVAMSARPIHALWGAFALGALLDLTNPIPLRGGEGAITVLGPFTLGMVVAAQFILFLRALMIRRNPLTVGFLAGLAGVATGVVATAVLGLRSLIDPIEWGGSGGLLVRCVSGLYTGLLGVVLALPLLPVLPMLGLATPTQRRFARRP